MSHNFMQNVKDIRIEERTSKQGLKYHKVIIEFNSGYIFEAFANNEQKFLIDASLKGALK